MAAGDRPSVKVYGKRKNTGDPSLPEYLDLAAFWVNEDGKLGGQWSRDIVAIKMRDRDGREFVVTAEQLGQYFCNLRDERERPESGRSLRGAPRADGPPPATKTEAAGPSPGGEDFGDDDIPFALPFTTY